MIPESRYFRSDHCLPIYEGESGSQRSVTSQHRSGNNTSLQTNMLRFSFLFMVKNIHFRIG